MSSFIVADSDLDVITYVVEAGGILTRVIESGSGSNVIICLHGAGSRADRFRRNLPVLARLGYRVLALDFPGHGFASKGVDFEYTTPSFARVLSDFVAKLDVGPVTLMGTSLGAHVAAWYACEEPSQVSAAVLIGAVGLVAPRGGPVDSSGRVQDTSLEGIRAKLKFLVFDPDLVTESWVQEERNINLSPGAPEALGQVSQYLAEGINEHVVGERYAALGVPTILVWGKQDRWVSPEVGYDLLTLLPDSPLVLLDRAGHAPYMERSRAFNAVVGQFLVDPKGIGSGVHEY